MATQLNGRGRKPVNRAPRKRAVKTPVEALPLFDHKAAEPAPTSAVEGVIASMIRMSEAERQEVLNNFAPMPLLKALATKGGSVAQLAKAGMLVERKSQDYNQTGGAGVNALMANRDAYFPFALKSHVQMIHTKSQRLISLAMKDDPSNFEGPRDTALDIINYGSFLAEWLDREERELDAAVNQMQGQ
jgi:hypothetical protein